MHAGKDCLSVFEVKERNDCLLLDQVSKEELVERISRDACWHDDPGSSVLGQQFEHQFAE